MLEGGFFETFTLLGNFYFYKMHVNFISGILVLIPIPIITHDISIQLIKDLAVEYSAKRIIFISYRDRTNFSPESPSFARYLMSNGFFVSYCKIDDFREDFVDYSLNLVVLLDLQKGRNVNRGIIKDLKYAQSYVWVYFEEEEDMEIPYIPFQTIFLIVRNTTKLYIGSKEIFEVYNAWKGGPKLVSPIGFHDANTGMTTNRVSTFDGRSNTYRGLIRVLPLAKDQEGGLAAKIPNFFPDLWADIVCRLNLTQIVDDKNWEINLNFDNTPFMSLPPLFRVTMKLFHKERNLEVNLGSYFMPFSPATWASTLFILFLLACGLSTVGYYRREISFLSFIGHFIDGLLVLSQQDAQSYVKFSIVSEYILTYTRLLLSVVIYCLYGGVVFAFITVNLHKPLFTSFQGIYENGRFNIISPVTKGYSYMKIQPQGTILNKLFNERMAPYELQPVNFDEGLEKVCRTDQRLLLSMAAELIDDYMIHYPGCQLDRHPVTLVKPARGWFIKPHVPYGEVVKIGITRLIESGSLFDTAWKKSVFKKEKEGDNFKPISGLQVLPLLSVYAIGIFVAFALLIIECLLYIKISKPHILL